MRKHTADPEPCGTVQVVHIQWDKSARGGQGARARNAVPQAFAIPVSDFDSAGSYLSVDMFNWGSSNAFVEPLSVSSQQMHISEGYRFGCVTVASHPEGLLVRYEYNRASGGAPDRWYCNSASGYRELLGRTFVVRSGEWVRVCYIGRFTFADSGNWWYEQTTVNVAWFGGMKNGRVFLDREPTDELRVLADLW